MWQWQIDSVWVTQLVVHISSWLFFPLNVVADLIWHKQVSHKVSIAKQVANKSKLGISRHHYSRSSLLCIRLRRCWISFTFIYFLQLLRFSLVASSVMDWFLICRLANFVWTFSSIYLFIRWSLSASIFSATYLDLMCVSCVEWKK
jgi:hypothetical protein